MNLQSDVGCRRAWGCTEVRLVAETGHSPLRSAPLAPATETAEAPARGLYGRIGSAAPVDHYHLWFDLRPTANDMEFVAAAQAMLGHMQKAGTIESFVIQRRKFGFAPSAIGEWHIDITTRDLAQLDSAFAQVVPRAGEMERLHAAVWSKVENVKTGLYRDFPDAVRAV